MGGFCFCFRLFTRNLALYGQAETISDLLFSKLIDKNNLQNKRLEIISVCPHKVKFRVNNLKQKQNPAIVSRPRFGLRIKTFLFSEFVSHLKILSQDETGCSDFLR